MVAPGDAYRHADTSAVAVSNLGVQSGAAVCHAGRVTTTDLSYDPYDPALRQDPYAVYRRLREETPLYYNEQFDFYAVSRFDDVEAGLVDNATFISGRGGILELI